MAPRVVRTSNRFRFPLGAALALCAVSSLPAAAQTVDTFDTNQAALSDPPGGASTVATAGADILGQNRGLSVKLWSGAGPVTAQVAAGALTVSVAGTTPDSRGEAVVTWDADTNALMLSPTGLGGVNLTSTGQAFRLTVASATAGVELTFTVYTDAGNASVSGLVLPAIASPTDIDVAFASFVTLAGTGADFASVGAITLAVRGTEKMLVLNGIQAVPSTANVAATLTDNTTSAQPGETLNYRATVSNTGPGTATAPNLNDPLDPATTLVPGSVEVSPLAFDDQYSGATVGTDFSVGAPGVLVNDVDGDGDPLVVAPTGARPTAQGGSATVNADGSFTYTPPVLFQGLDTFPYQADDGNGIPGPGMATIHVGCAAITVSPTTLDPGAVGMPYGPVTFTATGANGAVTWSVVGALPAGMNFSAAGVLDGTPTVGGTFPLTFVATDAAGCTGSQAITLAINSAPTITSANATTFTVGTFGTFTVTTSGFPPPSIARGGAALPGGVTFMDNGDGTGTLSGTPNPATGGTYALTFTATNVVGSTPAQSFTLTVNQAPAITSANSATFAPGLAGQTFTVTTTGFPRNPGMTIARTGTLPTGVTFTDNTDGTATIAGTPAAGTQSGSPYLWTVTASNGVPPDAVQDPFTFNVVCPVITVSGTIPALIFNTAMTPVTFTRTGGNGTITWSATGLPGGLSINASSGQVSGTPNQTGTFDVVVTATDAGACTGTRSITVTVAPVAVADTYNGGVDNTQYIITGGTTGTPGTPSVQNATRIVANDLPAGGVTATAGTFATGQGGSVTIATDGTYLYTPPLRSGLAAITSDTFNYTVQSNTGGGAAVTSAAATVTINLVGRVWYVLNNGAAGNGQSQSPLQTLAAAQTASTANDHIFIYTGSGTTANLNNGIVLKAGQRLIGQGVALVVNGSTLVPAGTNPLIGNSGGAAVTLADGNTISGLTISNPSGFGITGANVNTLTVSAGVIITGAGGGAFSLSGGNGAVDFGAAVTNSAGRAVSIVSRTGGTVTLSGAIADTGGTGILLNVNSGTSSFTFSGGITLNGTSSAFTATTSGTLTITGTNTIGATTAPTGPALNVTSTTIGGSGLTFRSVSATGGQRGLVLSNTGTSGGLTVTGTGTAGSGGRIQNTTGGDDSSATPIGTGVVLNNTKDASLNWMRLNGHTNYAIRGREVDGFRLTNTLIDGLNGDNVASPFNDGSVSFIGTPSTGYGLRGSVAFLDNEITGGRQRNVSIDNATGTMNLNFLRNNVHHTQPSPNGDDGFALEVDTSAVMFANVSDNTFTAHGGDHFNLSLINNANADLTFRNNNMQGGFAGALGQGVFILGASYNGTFRYDISNNGTLADPFTGNVQGGAIFVNKGSGTATYSGQIANNVIGNPAVTLSGSEQAVGIHASARGAGGSHTTLIHNNHVREWNDRGIVVEAGEGNPTLVATVTSNTVSDFGSAINSLHGIHFDFGILAADNAQITIDVRSNLIANAGNEPQGGVDFRMRTAGSNDVFIAGYSGGNSSANAQAFIDGQNPDGTTFSVSQVASGTYNNGPASPLPPPTLPTLPPAP